MKVFKNDRTDTNNELPIRKGTKVPEGAVSLGWYDTPDLNPENNLAIIDTSRFEGVNSSKLSIAYANSLGILEDEYGNQSWSEEFPIVGDQFLLPENIENPSQALPYVHISRYMHLDNFALAASGSLSEMPPGSSLKIIDQNGHDYSDENGNPKYKVFGVNVPLTQPVNSTTGLYRIWVFLDMEPQNDELYLVYHKAEYDQLTGYFKDEYIGYKEPLSVQEYYRYVPEESEVVDQSSHDKKLYSTKPIDFKDQIVGRSQPNYKGWQIQVPRKAIPDPRNFELFRWRIAAEYSRPVDPNETSNNNRPTQIRAGIVSYNSSGVGQSRANYLFNQLNESSYNTGGFDFVNPLNQGNDQLTRDDAAYWNVPINDVSIEDLDQFDILIWSASSRVMTLGDNIMPKIRHFVETRGGTFIFETCSVTTFNGIPGISFTDKRSNLLNTSVPDRVTVEDVDYFGYIPATPNSNISGMYGQWPPKVEDLFTSNTHSSDLVQNLNFLGGWDLDTDSELTPTSYANLSNASSLSMQYMDSVDEEWETVLDSKHVSNANRHPVLVRKKFSSGGSYYVSTASLFEDHIMSGGAVASSSYAVSSLDELSTAARERFSRDADSTNMEGEMKLRMNLAMLATAFRPTTNISSSPTEGFSQDYERHSVTLYSDWESSWVINAHDDVLSSEEKARFNFSLMPKDPEDPDPVWLRILSDKTVDEIMAEKIDEINSNSANRTFENFEGLNKRYMIMITNQNVETYSANLISGDTLPAAWTYTFSPKFNVPYELGPYSVREELVAGTGVGEGKRVYPRRPFKLRSTASYVTTGVESDSINVDVKFTGKARKVYSVPAKVERLPQPAYKLGWWIDTKLRWNTDSDPVLKIPDQVWGNGSRPHLDDIISTKAITTWSDANYKSGQVNNFASWAMHGHYERGNRGDIIRVIQRILNQFVFFKKISGPYLAEDGIFGYATEAAIIRLQTANNAIWVDGKLDAESWSLIGYALAALYNVPGWAGRADKELNYFGAKADQHLRLDHVSAGPDARYGGTSRDLGYVRQSLSSGRGASRISETWMLSFDPEYSEYAAGFEGTGFNMYGLVVQPYFYSYDKSKTATIDWLDVGGEAPIRLEGYNFSRASHGRVNIPVRGSEYTTIPFTPQFGTQVLFRMTTNGTMGGLWGSARSMGINDAYVLAKVYKRNSAPPPEPRYERTPARTIIEIVNIEATQNFTLKTGIPKRSSTSITNGTLLNDVKITTIDQATNEEFSMYPSQITEISWDSYEVIPSSKSGLIDFVERTYPLNYDGFASNYYTLTYNDSTTSVSEPNYVLGNRIGDGTVDFWVKPLRGSVEPFSRKYGWVSKDQGVLLISNQDGRPLGFPAASPTSSGREANFTRLTLDSWDTDQTLYYGFYDTLRNEWIENANGEPDMSYYDYIRRGVENVYIAVQTTYEIDTQSNLPSPDEPVMRPFKLAMPVYCVKTRNETSIKLRNPSKELNHKDIWPVSIGTGSFSKQLKISQDYADIATNYLKDYGSKTITAHYSLREGVRGPWSSLLGRPYKDNKNEEPRLLSDDTFKVNFAPIAAIQEPTFSPGPADPLTPLFTVYRRESTSSVWTEVDMEDIKEYDLSKGIISLKTPLAEEDPRLVKVDYTSRDYSYRYAHDGSKRVNLNPYILNRETGSGNNVNALDKPLYVYLLPSFVVDDENKTVISNTTEDRIVRVTEDKSVLDPTQSDYNPLAFQVGIIFTFTSADMRDLRILDTRVRGGGAKHHLENSELEVDASSYWDAPADDVYSYQKGGFVIIRLPAAIVDDFPTEESLREVITRNLTAGIAYKFQDYSGQPLFGD